MGSVYLRGKSYVGKYKDENGEWVRKTLGRSPSINKTIAKEILKGIERKIAAGEYDQINAKIPTIKKFSKDYLNHVRSVIQKRSWTRDELCLKHLLNFFGSSRIDKIKPKDVDDYKKYRLSSVKPATVNRELEVLRHLFNLAERWNSFFGKNPVSRSGLLKVNNIKERILTLNEEKTLLEASPIYLKNIIICALQTGMRKSEIITLEWNNVDFDKNLITIDQTNSKSKKQRIIPINSMLRKLLLEIKIQSLGTEFVFLNSDSLPYKRQDSLNRAFQLALKKANIADLRFHDLRHTAATRMVENTGNIVAVNKILGHADLKTTMRYAHPENSLKQAVESLAINSSNSQAQESGLI